MSWVGESRPRVRVSVSAGCRDRSTATIPTAGVIVTGTGDIPDFGDLAGLTRLYWLAVRRIRASDLTDDGKALILDEIGVQFRVARAGFTESPLAV